MSEHLHTGDYIAGGFRSVGAPDGELEVRSPADLDDLVGRFGYSAGAVDDAVAAAREAFPAWDRVGLEARCAKVRALGDALREREAALARAITRETGKTLREATLEARALATKVALSIDEGLGYVRDLSLDGGKLSVRHRPHGVCAVLGPFNFPMHLPHGHLVPALLAGNTVVFKPSEVTPACGVAYAEAAHAAGLPPGVFNLVQGEGAAGARLAAHPEVGAVLFTGSYAVGTRLQAALAGDPGRLLALELGGKNAAVVLDDAPFEKSVADVALSAFSSTGQRCTCASRLVVTRGIAERFVEAVARVCTGLAVGAPWDPGVFLGPLASRAGFERFHALERAADAEGSARVDRAQEPRVVFQGRALRGYYVSPRVRRVMVPDARSAFQREELFGPSLAVYVADDVDHALALANDTPYGLSAGVWTASEAAFERLARGLRVGCLTWNAPTVGASSRLPFGGVGRSGNHRPAGIFSSLYCAYPLAITRGDGSLDRGALPPGITV
jgi:succinylglutamic semialdehyde dehydrogenase